MGNCEVLEEYVRRYNLVKDTNSNVLRWPSGKIISRPASKSIREVIDEALAKGPNESEKAAFALQDIIDNNEEERETSLRGSGPAVDEWEEVLNKARVLMHNQQENADNVARDSRHSGFD